MIIIKYNLCTKINHGTEEAPNWEEILYAKEIRCAEDALAANEEIAKAEAIGGEYTVEDHGAEEPAQPTQEQRIAELEEALEMILSGVTE